MRKIYIFFTVDIRLMGGIQLYTLSKSRYLVKQGFEVYMFFDGYATESCKIKGLEPYLKDEILGLRKLPYEYHSNLRNRLLKRMKKKIGDLSNTEIIIESQDHTGAMWGELLGAVIHAKHMCFICNEDFFGVNKHYSDKLAFYSYKYDRKELYGISEKSIPNLLSRYRKIDNGEECCFEAATDSPIEEVECDKLRYIGKSDWTIGYIGRIDKPYVPEIIDGVSQFALAYSDKTIQFVVVGDTTNYELLFRKIRRERSNVKVIMLGTLFPIPKQIFSKLDALIAGAGCALYSAPFMKHIIIPDAGNYKSNGLLGYDTLSTLFAEDSLKQTDFASSLVDLLVKNIYRERDYLFNIDLVEDATVHFEAQLSISNHFFCEESYYDMEALLQPERYLKLTIIDLMKVYVPILVRLYRWLVSKKHMAQLMLDKYRNQNRIV